LKGFLFFVPGPDRKALSACYLNLRGPEIFTLTFFENQSYVFETIWLPSDYQLISILF